MDRLQKVAVLTGLAERMKRKGSWCGETHLQKAAHFLQSVLSVPLNFSFVLYKHGPFSFELREELAAMRADGLLELQAQQEPYGPTFVATQRSDELRTRYPKTLGRFEKSVRFVVDTLGDKGAAELERLGTALYMMQKYPDEDIESLAGRINSLKPHVSTENAKTALEAAKAISREAEGFKAA